MREVKFRAWMEDEMLSHDDLVNMDQETHAMYSILTEPQEDITFMQFTGLKDIEHRDVFEKDIVEDIEGKRYIVEYNLFYAYMLYPIEDRTSYMAMYPTIKLKVIGNIHENPELLEAKE